MNVQAIWTPCDDTGCMKRGEALSTVLGGSGLLLAASARARAASAEAVIAPGAPIARPKSGRIKVMFAISNNANVIDFAGPWETFQDVMLPDGDMPFELSTVAETTQIVETTGGLRIEPTYSYDTIPFMPNVLVVGAQSNHSETFMQLLRESQGKVDVTMSVCTGAFKLAMSGILDGKSATTHHNYYDAFAKQFPKVRLVRGQRFVDNGTIVTAGGLTSGISAALHVIARYYGVPEADRTAAYMEFVPTTRPA
jgi:transcriptional regulator GlxA family with amidase domain